MNVSYERVAARQDEIAEVLTISCIMGGYVVHSQRRVEGAMQYVIVSKRPEHVRNGQCPGVPLVITDREVKNHWGPKRLELLLAQKTHDLESRILTGCKAFDHVA